MLTTIISLIIAVVLAIVCLVTGGTLFALFGDIIILGAIIYLIKQVVKLFKKKEK